MSLTALWKVPGPLLHMGMPVHSTIAVFLTNNGSMVATPYCTPSRMLWQGGHNPGKPGMLRFL